MNINKLFDYSIPAVAAATIAILGLLIAVLYGGSVARDIKRANDTIVVTGSAKEAVTADQGRWTINLETTTDVNDQQGGFTRLDAAVEKIITYLRSQGFDDYETPTGISYANYTYPQSGDPIMAGYTVARTVTVRSNDIEKLSRLANNVRPLVGQGYNVSTGMLELTVGTLAEMRVSLLTNAIQDATDRANAIAKESGRTVGMLRNATGGVVQVLPAGGVEISDYGMYDTQSVEKEVMVTVRATFDFK
jgi:uncharacterized protein